MPGILGNICKVGRRGHYSHGLWQRGQKLLRSRYTVPITRNWLEAIVDGNVLSLERFKLLEDRRDIAPRGNISWEQQHGHAIYGSGSRARNHVGGSGANRRGAGERA